jgi:hypothetical protein
MSLTSYASAVNQALACTFSLGAWSSSLPTSNLVYPKLGTVARSASNKHGSTCLKITAVPAGLTSRCAYLVRHNLTGPYPGVTPSETTRFRWRGIYGSPGSPATFFPKGKPVAILASSNLSGAVVASLQEADLENKVGAWLTATSATTNTDLRVSLQASTCGLQTGGSLQTVLVLIRRTGGGGSNPTVTVDLYRSASLISNLVTATPVSSTSGTILTLTFNSTVLGGSPPSSENLEIRVRGTASATATVEVGAVQFLPEFVSNPSATVVDSGWISPSLPVNYWGPPRSLSQLYLGWEAANDFQWDELWFEAQAAANYDSYFEAGLLWIGQALFFQDALGSNTWEDLGIEIQPVDPSQKERMRSGGLDVQSLRPWKEIAARFSQLSKTGGWGSFVEGIQRFAGVGKNCLWVFRPGDTSSTPIAYGTLKSLDPTAQASGPGYSASLRVEETVG